MSIQLYLAEDLGQNFIQDKNKIKKLAENFLSQFQLNSYELGIHLVTKEEINRINQSYRNTDKPTDVLSFPIDEPLKDNKETTSNKQLILGDIFIAPEVVKKQADDSFEQEFKKILIHGLVHLLGFDHKSEKEQEKFDKIIEGDVV